MKRVIALVLTVFCMLSLFACPAPAPDVGGSTTTTTTTSGSGTGDTPPAAPLTLSTDTPYTLTGEPLTLTAGGTEGKDVWFNFPYDGIADPREEGVTLSGVAAEPGEHIFTVTDGTRVASCKITVFSSEPTVLPVTDENIRILGRTEKSADGDILFNNTASGLEVSFFGKSLSVRMCNDAGKSDTAKFAVYIDGVGDPARDQIDLRTAGVAVDGTREILLCSFDTPGLHTVRLQKITQEALATAVFSSLTVEGGLLPTEADEALRLMVYGDSITCGHSNMRADGAADTNNSTNENGMLTYAMRAAAMLDADAHIFARSGLGLYTDPYHSKLHLKDIWGKVSPLSEIEWDMSSWVPDAVVINIGTNDIWAPNGSGHNPPYNAEDFVDAYVTTVLWLCECWGNETAFFLCSSMMEDDLGAAVESAVNRLSGEYGLYVYYVELPHQLNTGGHPTNPSHEAAADVLYRAIVNEMGIA